MRTSIRRHSLILLLILTISQVALAVHAADHLDPAHQPCQLCHAHDDNILALLPSTGIVVAVIAHTAVVPITPISVPVTPYNYSYQPRAPPLFI